MPYQFKKGDYVRKEGNEDQCYAIAKAMEACGFSIFNECGMRRDGWGQWDAVCIDKLGNIVRTTSQDSGGCVNEVSWTVEADPLARLAAARKAYKEAHKANQDAFSEFEEARDAVEKLLGDDCDINFNDWS